MGPLIDYVQQLIHHMRLDMFVFVGTFIEEIISPIPSFVVLVPAGVSAHVQMLEPWQVLWLAVVCGGSRVVAGSIIYWLADKFEDVLLGGNRRLFGLTHKDVEGYGKRVSNTKPVQAWMALFSMHALPVFPGTLLSAGSGFIRLHFVLFATATFAGSIVGALFYLWVGYASLDAASLINKLGLAGEVLTVAAVAALIMWLLVRKHR